MPQIAMPNGDVVTFPGDMSKAQIKKLIASKFPEAVGSEIKGKVDLPNQYSELESGIIGAAQGATANFSDEIMAGLTAPVIYGGSKLAELAGYDTQGLADKSIAEIYSEKQRKSDLESDRAFDQNPWSYGIGNVAGAVGTGGAAASTKAGTAIAHSLRTGGLGARMAKGAVAGGASAAGYGAGSADQGERVEGAVDAIPYGAIPGGAIPVVGSALGTLSTSKPVQRTAEEFSNLSAKAYKKATETGGILTPEFTKKFLQNLDDAKPSPIGKKVLTHEDMRFINSIDEFKGLDDVALTLDGVQRIDEALGDKIDDLLEAGRVTKAAKKVIKIQDDFREMINNAADSDVIGGKEGFNALAEGRKLWAAKSKLDDLEKIITRAEMTDNPASALKTGFRNLYNNPARIKGFNTEEREAIKKIAQGARLDDFLGKVLGSRLNPIIAGASAGPGTGLVAQASSMVGRDAATNVALKRASSVANMIANEAAPLSKYLLPPPPPNMSLGYPAVGLFGSSRN